MPASSRCAPATLNQHGDEVCSFKRTFYVYRRGAEQLENLFPVGKSPLSLDGDSKETA